MKLLRFGIQPKKLVEDGHITLDEVVVLFGPRKANVIDQTTMILILR
jgi:hypothetical protein